MRTAPFRSQEQIMTEKLIWWPRHGACSMHCAKSPHGGHYFVVQYIDHWNVDHREGHDNQMRRQLGCVRTLANGKAIAQQDCDARELVS